MRKHSAHINALASLVGRNNAAGIGRLDSILNDPRRLGIEFDLWLC